jgi:tetratricopeptide (TPR) repeat protein
MWMNVGKSRLVYAMSQEIGAPEPRSGPGVPSGMPPSAPHSVPVPLPVPVPAPAFMVLLAALTLATAGCAGRADRGTTPKADGVVEMEELHITARRGPGGEYDFDVFDAEGLFKRGTEQLDAQRCDPAVELYDRLVREFPQSRYASAALYNAGLCLQALGRFDGAAERFGKLRTAYPTSEDRKDASFQLAEVLVQLSRWDEIIAVTDELLADDALSSSERLEAMARRSQGLLGRHELGDAERHARSSLSFFRTRPEAEKIVDEFFAAANNYVLAESFRLRAEDLAFPVDQAGQQQVLVKRAELLLQAQREYFNTISFTNLDNLHWAAASGYKIGAMYDELWHSVMAAPVPPQLPPEGHDIYHQELAKLIKPLIRHAIRYWELTLMLIERTGMQGEWAERTKADLERVRALMLQQPAGPGGLPTPPGTPPVTPSEVPEAAKPAT